LEERQNAKRSDPQGEVLAMPEKIKKKLEEEIIASGLFEPKAVWGYFPAQSDGNDVVVYDPTTTLSSRAESPDLAVEGRLAAKTLASRPERTDPLGGSVREAEGPAFRSEKPAELLRFTFPRQREGRKLCISDFFAPKSSGKFDVIGLTLVTVGDRASLETQRLFEGGEYTKYLYLHGLSVETAEALAEYHHKLIREELGIAVDDSPNIRDLFHQKYRGSRFSFGYPACPNLEDRALIVQLLKPEEIGVILTENHMLVPEQSTDAIIAHHPQAKYFDV